MSVTFEDFGAIGDGVADDTVAIQAALDSNDAIRIAPKTYKITAPVIQRKQKQIIGSGHTSRINAAFAQSAWKVDLSVGGARTGGRISDFIIYNTAGAALEFNLASGASNYISRQIVENMMLWNNAGGASLKLVNPTNTDGFFCSQIRNNFCMGGMYLARLGDSVTIDNNTITGGGVGIYADAVQGASHVIIRENNITSSSIAIQLGNYMMNTRIENNQIESSGAAGYAIYCGGSAGAEVYNPYIRGNNINGHNLINGALIYLNHVKYGLVDENITNEAPYRARIEATSYYPRIGKRNIGATNTYNNLCSTTIFE